MRSPFRLVLFILFFRPFRKLLILLVGTLGTIASLMSPIFQQELANRLTGTGTSVIGRLPFVSNLDSSVFLLLAVATFLAGTWLGLYAANLAVREAVKTQSKLADFLYGALLKARPFRRVDTSVGELVANYATDVQSSTALIDQTLPSLAVIFLPLFLGPYFVIVELGVPAVPLLWALAAILGLNLVLGKRQTRLFQKFKSLAGDRIALVNEWITYMRQLKVLSWVRYFESRIVSQRETETFNRIRMVTNGQTLASLGSSANFVLAAVGLYATSQQPAGLDPGRAFAIFWVLGVFVARPIRQFPWIITFGMDAWTSVVRLHRAFRVLEDQREAPNLVKFENQKDPKSVKDGLTSLDLAVSGLTLQLNGRRVLDDVSIRLKSGELAAIVGDVGSGKTQLLLSLLGETPCAFTTYQVGDQNMLEENRELWSTRFAFVGEEPFVLSGSVRENVLLKYQPNLDQDEKVLYMLDAARLDLNELGGGDEALSVEIGERGVNLSGGQKQRLALARGLFFEREILLLDDVFSAVDVRTEASLLEKLQAAPWKLRTRLIVTHRMSLLQHVDQIIFMKAGRVVAAGGWKDLWNSSEEFRQLVTLKANSSPAATIDLELRGPQ